MEQEILQQLELIRVYLYIIMLCISIFIIMKIINAIQHVYVNFRSSYAKIFENRMANLMDIGEYDKIIKECREVLDDKPNHTDANWFIAKAYYYKNDNELSIKYFEKAIYLVPSWEETADHYINKLKTANKTVKQTV